ncbi:Permease [Candidatus Terasakiella magnetica]|uniref:Permease n=1 Tax=Candidatus Terasakiella magnetica TaxID=1867952 RepID=A0A1C3RFN1_9PROT|nr:SO_0444 family Cu/Zn efflux transporter [Candidatus Terasakiella magnetica]SCA56103.1 Permease [Candidatus Terasakiella magnetica]
MELLTNTLHLFLEAAPWLLFGLVMAGVIKAWMSEKAVQKYIGGKGIGSIFGAALFGAPLPLCSCGVLPAAVGMRRAGGSRPATLSFLISTPETGVDSVAVSYALLGPFMAIVRPIAAVSSAVFTGVLAIFLPEEDNKAQPAQASSCCKTSCCGNSKPAVEVKKPNAFRKTLDGVSYALSDILDDIALWLGVGLLVAGVVTTYVPEQALVEWGSGPLAMLVMLVIGIPMYICATASTPLAASFLIAGVSPGAVMVFLLAGPATNMATIAVVKNEMGTRTMWTYLAGVCISSLAAGFVVNQLVSLWAIDIQSELAASAHVLPEGVEEVCAIILGLLLVKRLPAMIFTKTAPSNG